jgi:hypothetical protein
LIRSPRMRIFLIVVLFGCVCKGQAPDRNTIKGVIVSEPDTAKKSNPQPVVNAVAVAYDLEGKPLVASPPTKADGKFSFVVPESIKQFKVQFHQEELLFWASTPSNVYSNVDNPQDLGEIVMNNKFALSQNEIEMQVAAAERLHLVHDQSAGLLLDKVMEVYAREYTPSVLFCSGGGVVPLTIDVAYHAGQRPSKVPRITSSELPRNSHAVMLLNAKVAMERIRNVNLAEQKYFDKNGHYAGYDELEKSGLSEASDFFPPGYCIDIVEGIVTGRSFSHYTKGSPNHYIVFGAPLKWKVTGNVYLYSNPTGIIRYSRSTVSLKSLNEGIPVDEDFPLGLEP